MPEPSAHGYYFQDFALGQMLASPGRTVTEADIVAFAALSGDWNAIHTDAVYAASTPYGQRIAHGLLGLAIASGLAVRAGFIEGTVRAFIGLEWKFKGPVFAGDTITLGAEVTRLRAMPSMGGGMVTLKVRVTNQRGETVQEGDWTMLMAGRPTEPS
jgi:acyl dehydratase